MWKSKEKLIFLSIVILIIFVIIVGTFIYFSEKNDKINAKKEFELYITAINEERYDELYDRISNSSKEKISRENFIARNSNIYSGINLENIELDIKNVEETSNNKFKVDYDSKLNTSYGTVNFSNFAIIVKEDSMYKIEWTSNLIFPNLDETDKVRVKTLSSKRGNIYDRNDNLIAGEGKVNSIGFVPGKMNEDFEKDILKISELLDMKEDTIKKLLNASYVKDDTFVELKNVSLNDTDLIDKVLEVKGIKVIQKTARVYPYGESISHLVGYIQNISAEELEKHIGEGYTSSSVIGKTGLERSYEGRLRGVDGVEIIIIDENGKTKETLFKQDLKNGEDLKITIDAEEQLRIYNEFKTQKGFFVVMNPKTGEMLALVSTPSFDSNDFANGLSTNKWNSLNEDVSKPLYNRYTATWCPGSTFKPVTAAIGVNTGKIDQNEDFGHSGYSYKKDESWGDYQITTLQEYFSPAILQNALKYSDNIYFAKVGMKIGAETLANELLKLGFNENLEFSQYLNASTFSNTGKFETEIKLADSSYGQGEILVNPIHMASIYSSFVNNGNMIKPYLEYTENINSTYYKENAFSRETANIIKEDLIQVVEGYDATAHRLKTDGITIAAKTGTAELKKDKESEAMELSWLNAFTADENTDKQYLVISMREDDNSGDYSLFPLVKSIFE